MTSHSSENRKKRKRRDVDVHIDDAEDEPKTSIVVAPFAANIDESKLVSFPEFRQSTIQKYSSLKWLGPGVMAVYWFKEYLKKSPFDWIRCPKQDQQSSSSSSSPSSSRRGDEGGNINQRLRRQKRLCRLPKNSKSHFFFIPGQYLRNVGQQTDTNTATLDLAIQNVLYHGTPGTHYATSYIGVYNLLRRYGRFVTVKEPSTSHKISETKMKRELSRLLETEECSQMVVPADYRGPTLTR